MGDQRCALEIQREPAVGSHRYKIFEVGHRILSIHLPRSTEIARR
jgi:hypothetical protein